MYNGKYAVGSYIHTFRVNWGV